jgi:hypothetical protein
MKLLKYITTFVLLSAFLLALIMPAVLQLQRRYVQWEMMEALEEKELITIIVDADSIQWIETGKECLIDGELFDVKKHEQQEEKLTLTGLFDIKEKEIKASIAKQTEHQQNNQSKQIVKLLLLLATPFIETSTDIPLNETSLSKQLYKHSCYLSPFTGNCTPPPRLM